MENGKTRVYEYSTFKTGELSVNSSKYIDIIKKKLYIRDRIIIHLKKGFKKALFFIKKVVLKVDFYALFRKRC